MSILTPNEIAGLIYWSGNFGPGTGVTATDNHGNIVQHIPAPGTPERKRVETWLDIAIAICLAESGGDTNAKNASSASGLWQILVSAHAKEIHDALLYWETELANGKVLTIFDPRVNTYAAGLVYQGQGFKAWEAYTTGAYKKFLGHGPKAYTNMTNPANLKAMQQRLISNLKNDKAVEQYAGTILPGGLLSGALSNTPSWLSGITAFLASGALAVGVFVLAMLLLIIGAWILISHSKEGKTAASVLKKLPI